MAVNTFAFLLLMACSTGQPEYKLRLPGETVGYTDLRLSENRYRVAFSGSSVSKRDDVENYLLRRAAEVTVQAGYAHFTFDMRETERDTYYVGDQYIHGPYDYPYRTWYGSYPYWYGSTWPATRYSAFAEITMLKPEEAGDRPNAIDAFGILRDILPPTLPLISAQRQPKS